MTTYTHNPNNHLSRRASISATAPYTIPSKVKDHSNSLNGLPFPPTSNIHIPQHQQPRSDIGHTSNSGTPPPQRVLSANNTSQQQTQQLSSSVPLLSREFVVRRISEGETGRLKEELKCEACGKGYKHISSLAKHLWEHTPEWNVTKKLLISKHQQVQLLEAASILVSMNTEDEQQATGLMLKNSDSEDNQVRFKSSYQDNTSPQPILEEDEDDDDDEDDDEEEKINIKLRTGSISQYPPSAYTNSNGGINRRFQKLSSPESIDKNSITGGSFLDTPTKNNNNGPMESISGVISGDENKENKDTGNISSNGDEEDDGTVFGKMD